MNDMPRYKLDYTAVFADGRVRKGTVTSIAPVPADELRMWQHGKDGEIVEHIFVYDDETGLYNEAYV
jgi:hypothetical protein